MSTKIFTAYRVPVDLLPAWLSQVRPQMLDRVCDRLEQLMRKVSTERIRAKIAADKATYAARGWTWDDTKEDWREFYERFEIVYKYAERVRAHVSGFLLIDCGFSVWLYEGSAFLIPWGAYDYWADLDLPAYTKDYKFWNNTDRPEEIPEEEWEERAKTWDAINQSSSEQWETNKLIWAAVDVDRSMGSLSYGTLMIRIRERWEKS